MTKIAIAVLVGIHLAVAVWHGNAHTALAIALPPEKNAFVFLVILIAPLVAASLAWTRYVVVGGRVGHRRGTGGRRGVAVAGPSSGLRRCLNPRLSPFPVSPSLIPDGGVSPVRLEARAFPVETCPVAPTA
jgi:hypothetical protein